MTETITFEETGALLGLAAARDQRTVGDADILAWHSDLNAARVTARAAQAALTHYYAVITPKLDADQRHRINAPDLIGIIRRARIDRLNSGAAVDDGNPDETTAEYLERKRGTQRDIADGRTAPRPALAAIGPAPANTAYVDEDDVRAMRQQRDFAAFRREGMRAATATNDRRKRLVLAHPDLAEQLTKAPISLARPDCWSGYVPPEHLTSGAPNRSPVREQLAGLVAEAERRAAAPRTPAATAAGTAPAA
jgi:hypothetical protein